MKVATIVGARPQFVKAAVVSPVLRAVATELLVHTGQHYDYEMSQVFFEQLQLPAPDHHLGVGSGSHGAQTGEMLVRIETVLLDARPDWVVVYGDTNSTLAGALAAAKLEIPVAHVEAGMRSFVRSMPEEINRVLTDLVSTLLFSPTGTAVRNLAAEGIQTGVHEVGDLMAELLQRHRAHAVEDTHVLARFALEPRAYVLATIHRAANTASAAAIEAIVRGLAASRHPVLMPLHPRTRAAIERFGIAVPPVIRIVEPVGYFEMLALEAHARLVATDSGGVQKEAYLFGVPCLTLRDETEWPETVDAGWNRLVGAQTASIAAALADWQPPPNHPDIFGSGSVAQRIVDTLVTTTR